MTTDPQAKPTCIRDLRGPKADVLTRLANDFAISQEMSAYLTAEVGQSPHAGVVVHAHRQAQNGECHIAISITRLFAWLLLLSSILLSG